MKPTIRKGVAPPPIKPRLMRGSDLAEAATAMLQLKPGEWFIVPGTLGKDEKKTGYIRHRLRKLAKENSLLGMIIGQTLNDQGVLVKMASDGLDEDVPEPTDGSVKVRPGTERPGQAARRI